MRIVLISTNTATTPYPVYPLGMSTVAGALRGAGHEVTMLDWLTGEMNIDSCRSRLLALQPELVGISIRNLDNVNLLGEKRYLGILPGLVGMIHEAVQAPVVLGGSGYSLLPEEILALAGADYGIAGEGEALILELTQALAEKRAPVKGTVWRGREHLQEKALHGGYYDPALLGAYLEAGSITPVQTKRGCRLRCAYCSYPVLEGGHFRARPAREVVDEVEALTAQQKVPYVFFTDSVFNDDEGHYQQVLQEMQRRGIKVPWTAFLKPTGLTRAAIELMRSTGLAAVELGSDAASDATLRGLRKPFTFKEVVAANDLLREQGVAVAHYFMFGGPEETQESVREGIANIQALRCTAAFVFLGIRILPHTELHRRSVAEGVLAKECDLVEPVYYLSPRVEQAWMHETLSAAFADMVHVVYPPDALDDKLQMLHKLGYAGSLWDLLGSPVRS